MTTKLNGEPEFPVVQPSNLNSAAIIISKERPGTIIEVAVDRIMASLWNSPDLLIIQDFSKVTRIVDPATNNMYKDCMLPLPGYDAESFPFVIVSGAESTNIVNSKKAEMQVLIKSPTGVHGANMGFFKHLPDGFEFHFLTSSKEEKKDFWRSMWFDADFIEFMKQCG